MNRLNLHSSHADWFAVRTRSRQEKTVATMLEGLGVEHFLPLKSEVRQWSDRKQIVLTPLFSGYVFIRLDLAQESRLNVLGVPGIAGLVGTSAGPATIPVSQIETVRAVLRSPAEYKALPLLKEGSQVRVVRGALSGIQGIMLRTQAQSRLLISIELLHTSLAVNVALSDVEPVNTKHLTPKAIGLK